MSAVNNSSTMMDWAQPEGSALLLAVVVGILGLLMIMKQKSNSNSEDEPPLFPGKNFLNNFFGPHGPMYLLELSGVVGGATIIRIPPLLFGPSFYILLNHRAARKALEDKTATKFQPAAQFFEDTTAGPNMVTESGPRWKHVRRSTAQAFSSASIKQMIPIMDEIVDKWCHQTLPCPSVDILAEMNTITATIIGRVAFDYDFSQQQRERILACVETCWLEFGQKMGINVFKRLPVTRWMFSGIREAQAAAQEMFDICQNILDDYRLKNCQSSSSVIHAICNDADYNNDAERVRDMVAFVIAGFDTTANTLAFCFRELAMNPLLQSKLRESIRTQDHTYLRAFVKEALRLYPAAALGSVRQLQQPLAVPRDSSTKEEYYILPTKSIVLTAYYGMQRDESVYKNAHQFLPERWLEKDKQMTEALLSFSAGPRNCHGQALATAELHQVLAKLVDHYEFRVLEAGEAQNRMLFKPVGTLLEVSKVEK